MHACMQPMQSGHRYNSSSSSSSSSSKRSSNCWQHCRALPKLPCAVLHHVRDRQLSSKIAAAASPAGGAQPGKGDDDITSRQEVAQQGIRAFEQQLEQQQQSPADRAEELDASAALLAATADSPPGLEPESEQLFQQQQELHQWQQEWQQHQPWYRTARNLYMAMAVGLTAAGALVSVGAGPVAAAGLKLGAGLPAAQAAVLVGCFGAAVLRAASLAWFLSVSACGVRGQRVGCVLPQ
jgi:hypothetical protein